MTNKKLTILTCMDSRLDPIKIFGLAQREAHIIRNAGGRATEDALNSIIVSQKILGTKEFWVIHHTQCLMGNMTDELISELPDSLRKSAFSDLEQSVIDDIELIKNHELLADDIQVRGFIYDLEQNELKPVI
jgi:carbonic anhydrase